MSAISQAQQLREMLPPAKADEADKPRVLIKSPLVLTREQEDNLIEHAKTRFKDLSQELGRSDFTGTSWATNLANNMRQRGVEYTPFLAERFLADQLMEGRVGWRRQIIGGIFAESNYHLPLCGRIIPQQIARACDSFFGTSPWMTATPAGPTDDDLAEKVTQWTRHEADKAELESTLRDAISLAFPRGECVMKLHHDRRLDYYKTVREIAILDGKPVIVDLDKDYVFKSDLWEPIAPPINPAETTPEQHAALPPVGMILKRTAGSEMPFQQPANWSQVQWVPTSITRLNKRFDGPMVSNVNCYDFLCPTTAPTVQDADTIIHVRADPLVGFVHNLMTADEWSKALPTAEDQQQAIAQLLANVPMQKGEYTNTAADRPRADLQESQGSTGVSKNEEHLVLAECWMHYACTPGGTTDSIVLIMDSDGRVPIYYDYAANMTPDGLRPFEVVRVNPVPGRWHGIGQVTKFYSLQFLADLLFNRLNYSMSAAGRVDFWNTDALTDGDNPNLELNGGKTYRLKTGKKAQDVLQSVYLSNIKSDELINAIQMVVQWATNMSGIANANDSRAAGLDTAELATGVKNIERSGQELFGKFLSDLTPPIRRVVKRFLLLVVANFDKPRSFKFFEGDVKSLATLTPEEVRDLDLDVTIDLTRYSQQERKAEADAVWQVVSDWMSVPNPNLIALLRPIVVQRVKALGLPHAEKYIPTTEQIMQALMPAMPAQEPGAPPGVALAS